MDEKKACVASSASSGFQAQHTRKPAAATDRFARSGQRLLSQRKLCELAAANAPAQCVVAKPRASALAARPRGDRTSGSPLLGWFTAGL